MKKIFSFIIKLFMFIITICKVIKKGNLCSGLKKEKRSSPIAIFANGPSLNEAINQYLNDESFKNVDIMVLNDFFRSYSFRKLKPKYYCLCDPTYFKTVGYDDDNENTKILWQSLESNVTWPMKLFIPKQFFKEFMKFVNLKNENISVTTFNELDYKGFEKYRFLFYNYNFCTPHFETVSLATIYISLIIGYKKLLLYGMEHSWVSNLCVRNDNVLCNVYEHFWDNNKVEIKEIRYPIAGHHWKIADFLDSQARMFHQHDVLQEFSICLGSKIINCTPNSMITSYERCPMPIDKTVKEYCL